MSTDSISAIEATIAEVLGEDFPAAEDIAPTPLYKQGDKVTLRYGQEYLGHVRQAEFSAIANVWLYVVTWVSPTSHWHWYPEQDLEHHG